MITALFLVIAMDFGQPDFNYDYYKIEFTRNQDSETVRHGLLIPMGITTREPHHTTLNYFVFHLFGNDNILYRISIDRFILDDQISDLPVDIAP